MKAFPDGSVNEWGNATNGGMDLRDYFAAQAVSGILVSQRTSDARFIAAMAYQIADAMMKARK